MKRKILVIFVIGMFSIVSFTTTGLRLNKDVESIEENKNYDIRPLMKIDSEFAKRERQDYNNADKAFIDPSLEKEIQATESYSILNLLDYIPEERDQGWCGNCWAWPATGVLAIALNVQEGIFERLSLQYINSCGEEYTSGWYKIECCGGGNLNMFANFYRATDKAIPWSNDNAHWQDGRAQCRTPCDSISTDPHYPISSIRTESIDTHEIEEAEAIQNVKNVLHQQKGVYFSWYLPDMDYRQHFGEFWSEDDEDDIYDLDWDCGAEFSEEDGGGHGVLCVGYNDEAGENNDYWIMLNSWGKTSNRPNGLFAVNMHMDYDCTVFFGSSEEYTFNFRTLNVTFASQEDAPDAPVIQGPGLGATGSEQTYEISAYDEEGDDVYFYIDWDDGTYDEWIGPAASGEEMEVSHTWEQRGDYTIRAKAKDTNNVESFWSTLEVTMPKSKTREMPFFEFLRNHRIFQILFQRFLEI